MASSTGVPSLVGLASGVESKSGGRGVPGVASSSWLEISARLRRPVVGFATEATTRLMVRVSDAPGATVVASTGVVAPGPTAVHPAWAGKV